MTLLKALLPEQRTGTKTGAKAYRKCPSVGAAKDLYKDAARRLLAINSWGAFSGEAGAEFCLTNAEGVVLTSATPEKGHLIRISLPGPGNKAGNGYDWVRIEEMGSEESERDDYQSTTIRVRPVAHPSDRGANQTAHFYTDDATSTFSVIRRGRTVYAVEFGRNEVGNTKVSLLNSLRNFIVALGARLGIASLQWKLLMEGLLNHKD